MFGQILHFQCPLCGCQQRHTLGAETLYRIDDMSDNYAKLTCDECQEVIYVMTKGYIVKDLSQESKEAVFQSMVPMLGDTEYSRKRFFESAKFVLASEAVIPEKSAKTAEKSVVVFF